MTRRLVFLLFALTLSSTYAGELLVVVHKSNPTNELNKTQLIDLYMGKYVAFPNGEIAKPIDIAQGEDVKQVFYKHLVGLSLARVNAYWSRLRFSGRVQPPLELETEQQVIDYLASHHNAIGYISERNLTKNLKVVYRIHE